MVRQYIAMCRLVGAVLALRVASLLAFQLKVSHESLSFNSTLHLEDSPMLSHPDQVKQGREISYLTAALCENHTVASGKKGVPVHRLRNLKWLHIPKTGNTFVATLWNYACGQGDPWGGGQRLDLSVDPKLQPDCPSCYDMALKERYPIAEYCAPGVLSQEGKHRKFVTQHRPISLRDAKRGPVVGLFRRPNQRLLSSFRAQHTNGFPDTTEKELMTNCSMWAINGSGRGHADCFARFPGIAGCMTRMLTGGRCAESSASAPALLSKLRFPSSSHRVAAAKKVIRTMSFVGLTERWDESVCLFHRLFGGKVDPQELQDMHLGKRGAHVDYDESELKGFVDHDDEAVYAAAVARFEELKRAALEDISELLNSSSLCGADIMIGGGADSGAACSCAAAHAQCGQIAGRALNCGSCPVARLNFTKDQGQLSAAPRCSSDNQCLVLGEQRDIFSWYFQPGRRPKNH